MKSSTKTIAFILAIVMLVSATSFTAFANANQQTLGESIDTTNMELGFSEEAEGAPKTSLLPAPVPNVSAYARGAELSSFEQLKDKIENSTTDLDIELAGNKFEFTSTITNSNNIIVRLVGKGETEFVLSPTVPAGTRFLSLPQGTLVMDTIKVTGIAGASGGISTKDADITNCVFTDNYGGNPGGGAINVGYGNDNRVQIKYSDFRNNSTNSDGAAIRFDAVGASSSNSTMTVYHCNFEENVSNPFGVFYGGAISSKNTKGAITIDGCRFINNTVSGGIIARGGAFTGLAVGKITIINNVFMGNRAGEDGGAIHIENPSRVRHNISYNTFANNSAGDRGGAIYFYGGTLQHLEVGRCFFVDNSASGVDKGNAVYFESSGMFPGSLYTYSNTLVRNGIKKGTSEGNANSTNNLFLGTVNPTDMPVAWGQDAAEVESDYFTISNTRMMKNIGMPHRKPTPTQPTVTGAYNKTLDGIIVDGTEDTGANTNNAVYNSTTYAIKAYDIDSRELLAEIYGETGDIGENIWHKDVSNVIENDVLAIDPGYTLRTTELNYIELSSADNTIKLYYSKPYVEVDSITFVPDAINMYIGDTNNFNVVITPSNATNKAVVWKSNNESIATVDANGLITAIAEGETTISAKLAHNDYEAIGTVTVTKRPVSVTGVTLNKHSANMETNQTLQLIATVLPDNANNKAVIWSSSNPAIATVDNNGLVTTVDEGIATITVTTADGGFQDNCVVSVRDIIRVTDVSLNKVTEKLKTNQTLQLTETVTPTNADDKSVTWASSNSAVATVDANGLVTTLTEGNATITVTTNDGNHKATCSITVDNYVAVNSISLNKTTAALTGEETLQLIATVLPADATNKNVTWSSSNTNFATVDSNGFVTTKNVTGSVVITATTVDGGHTARCTVNITKYVIPLTSLKINPQFAQVKIGETLQLNPVYTPTNTTEKNLTWSTVNGKIASVDQNGLVSSIRAGSTQVVARNPSNTIMAVSNITVPGRTGKYSVSSSSSSSSRASALSASVDVSSSVLSASASSYTTNSASTVSNSTQEVSKQFNTQLTEAVKNKANAQNSVVVSLHNVDSISTNQLKEFTEQAKNNAVDLKLNFDTIEDQKVTQRISISPINVSQSLTLSTDTVLKDKTQNQFNKYYSNNITTFALNQKESVIADVAIVSPTNPNNKPISIYTFSPSTNTYTKETIVYKVDNNGYIHAKLDISKPYIISVDDLVKK